MRKRNRLMVMGLSMVLGAACMGSGMSVSADADYPTFALVAYNAIGDRGFVDTSVIGVEKALEEYDIDYKYFSCNTDATLLLDTLKTAAENYDVIFIIPGYNFDVELEEVYNLYPDKTYIYIDGESTIEGVHSCIYSQNEGAFLAGVLAASLTTETSLDYINEEKLVGFLGGQEMSVIHDYQVGFEQGVAYVDPEVEVIVKYTGDHFDPAGGKVAANNIHDQGADVIFQVAGPTGLGVLEAASEYEFYAIGVDTDQGYLQPGFVPSSMLKGVDASVYEVIKKCCEQETLDAVMEFNVANGGISLADNEYYQEIVPEAVRDVVEEAKEKIISGEIVVDSYYE